MHRPKLKNLKEPPSQRTKKAVNIDRLNKTERNPTGNRRLAQWRLTWLIEHSTSHQLLWCIDSFVLRNRNRPANTILANCLRMFILSYRPDNTAAVIL
jgi:hypothetical protein